MSLNALDEIKGELNGTSLFNSPMGCSKRPLLYDYNTPRSNNKKTNIIPNKTQITSENLPQNTTFQSLPFELRLKISNHLSQLDCLSLMLTSKQMYMTSIQRLYQYIIIDENYSQFTKEYGYINYENVSRLSDHKEFSCSYINSSYNLKKFIKSYILIHEKKSNISNLLKESPYIKKIQCIKLPDSFYILDHDVHTNLLNFFNKLQHLRELIWWNEPIPFEFLEEIPNKDNLVSLKVNIEFSKFLGKPSPFDKIYYVDYVSNHSKRLYFPNLETFSIKPFESSDKLINIINNILIGKRSGRSVGTRLKSLEVSRFEKNGAVLIPSCYDLITDDPTTLLEELDKDILFAIFKKSKFKYFHVLSELSLNNCLITSSDYSLLKNSINLSGLVTLRFINVSEYRVVDDMSDIPNSSILSIAPYLSNLKNLYIDLREAVVDSIPLFLKELSTESLRSLDLIMRYNDTKLQTYSGIVQFNDKYAEAIVSGNKPHSLKHLSIEVIQENPFCDINIPIVSDNFYKKISFCKKLVSLRLNPNDYSNSLVKLVTTLPLLRFLHIFGQKTGGSPNLGLGMVYPSVYDEWFKVQHIAMLYLQESKNLVYIRINECIFEVNSQLQLTPRDGIKGWFDDIVRVS